MINSLLLLMAAQADPALSLDLRARPLSEVLEAISKSTQVSHVAAPAHAKEIMLIRFKDRPLSEVRRKIAWALDATWTQTESGWTLARASERTKEIDYEARAVRRKSVAEFFTKLREKMKATPTAFSRIEAASKSGNSRDLDAGARASFLGYWTHQIWLDLGADVVADTPLEGSMTFSDSPNSAQRPLPSVAKKHLEDMVAEGREFAQIAATGSAVKLYGTRPLKTLVKLFRLGSSYGIWLTAYGPSGEELYSITNTSSQFGTNAYAKPDELGKRAPNETFPLSPLQAEYERVRERQAEFAGNLEPIKMVTASEELIESLLNPEKVDPLSYWNSEAVLRWADTKSVCVCLPDRIDFAARYCLQPGKFQLGKFKQIAEEVASFKTVGEPNWFLGRPSNGPASEKSRFNRSALGTFLRASYEKRAEAVDGFARYHFEAGKQAVYFGFWSTIRETFWKFGVKPIPDADSHSHEVWALLGSMKKAVAALEGGQLLLYSNATPAQKALMSSLVFSNPYLVPEPDSNLVDLQLEPTEWPAGGLGPGSSFAVVGAKDIAILAKHEDPQMAAFARPKSATEIGIEQARNSKLDLAATFSKVVLGPRSRLLVRFKPIPQLVSDESIFINFGPVSKPIAATDLPADFVRAAQESWRAERAKVSAGGR